MKDEEMAEEYAKAHIVQYPKRVIISENGFCTSEDEVKQAFLAGLKAGRSQWHDLRKDPNDLPKDEKDVQVLYQDCDKLNTYNCVYDIHAENWLYYNLDSMVLELFTFNVIAWCEIPTFDKE